MKRLLATLIAIALPCVAHADDFRLKGIQLRLVPVTAPDGACLTLGVCLWNDINTGQWKIRNPNQTDTVLGGGSSYYQTIKDGDNVSATQRANLRFTSDFTVTDSSPSTMIGLAVTPVPTSRTISTTAPLGGGGALSGNLTLTCSTCVTLSGSQTLTNKTISSAILSGTTTSSAAQMSLASGADPSTVDAFKFNTTTNYADNTGNTIGLYNQGTAFGGLFVLTSPANTFGILSSPGYDLAFQSGGAVNALSGIADGSTPAFALTASNAFSATHPIFQLNNNATPALIIYGNGSALFGGATGSPPFSLTDAATIATDANNSNTFLLTLTGDHTLGNPTHLVAGFTYAWRIEEDGSGGHTLSYDTYFKWPGGTALTNSTGAGAVDWITCFAATTSRLECVGQADFQ